MKFETFEMSFAVSALLAGYLFLTGTVGPAQAVMLFALSQGGYFALSEIKKSGLHSPYAEALFAIAVFSSYFAAALSLSTLFALFSTSYVPLAFCVPAAVSVVHRYISG